MIELTKTMEIQTGCIIRADNAAYRVLGAFGNNYQLVKLDVSQIIIVEYPIAELRLMVQSNKALAYIETYSNIVDTEPMSPMELEAFTTRLNIVTEVIEDCHNDYTMLVGKAPKNVIKRLCEQNHISRKVLWTYIRKYVQSGFSKISLVDLRCRRLTNEIGTPRQYTKKPGTRKSVHPVTVVIVDDEIRAQFESALQRYIKRVAPTLKSSYDWLLNEYYTTVDNNGNVLLAPSTERPSWDQYRHYYSTHLTQEQKDIIQADATEVRNNKRLILGSSRSDATFPGCICQVDALEPDLYIVSEADPSKIVGRAYIYFMVDECTSAVVAAYVSYENNSYIGLTNLFMNLADDKTELVYKLGMDSELSANRWWPSIFIPQSIRCDRGSDFDSNKIKAVCERLNVKRLSLPPALGSYKGIVEQSFHQFHEMVRPSLVKRGLVTKRQNSDHMERACLTIKTLRQMVVAFVYFHNQQQINDYKTPTDMIVAGISPTPQTLWEYFTQKEGSAEPIRNREQFLFDLMEKKTAKLSRSGINYSGLTYVNVNDSVLMNQMYEAGTKRIAFEIRIDARDVSRVYYTHDNKLYIADLNLQILGQDQYKNMTWFEYEQFRKKEAEIKAIGRDAWQDTAVYAGMTFEAIASNGQAETKRALKEAGTATKKESSAQIRENKQVDRQGDNHAHSMASRLLPDAVLSANAPAALPQTDTGDTVDTEAAVATSAVDGGTVIPVPTTPESSRAALKEALRRSRNKTYDD